MPNAPNRPTPPDPQAALDLTRAILARTSGSPCARVQELGCEYVDGELEATQARLVRAHLDHCPGCAQWMTALSRATALLPRLAEVDPGPWFTARVMRATVHAPRRASKWRATWLQLLHRPRIALEAAYVGTAMSLMGLALPLPVSLPSPRTLAQTLSPEPFVAPLKAPAQRVLGQIVVAEQRTLASVQRGLKLGVATSKGEAPAGLWQRASQRVRGWLRQVRGAPQDKVPNPTNP
ncbi:MAG TPA: zf-HC2 domain-containing protein [Holophagaceae bacterium]|nr:zf-HC2 domain-containing protein [Holophagaceae bacterium]